MDILGLLLQIPLRGATTAGIGGSEQHRDRRLAELHALAFTRAIMHAIRRYQLPLIDQEHLVRLLRTGSLRRAISREEKKRHASAGAI